MQKSPSKYSNLYLNLCNYFSWLAIVEFASLGHSVWGLCVLLFDFVLFFVLQIRFESSRGRIWLRMILFCVLGLCFDVLAEHQQWIQFFDSENTGAVPLWLGSLWLLLSFNFMGLALSLHRRPKLNILLGLIFGPLTYYCGKNWGLVAFNSREGVIAYALFWSLYFPVGIHLARPTKAL